MATAQGIARFGPLIPAAPFVAWVNAEIAKLDAEDLFSTEGGAKAKVPSVDTFAARVGVGEKTVRRWRDSVNGKDEPTDLFHRYPVEDALHRAGVPFERVYPEIAAADQVSLEPDIWCPSCESKVTPIGGLCPWCTPEPGHRRSCPGCGGWRGEYAQMCKGCRTALRRGEQQVAA